MVCERMRVVCCMWEDQVVSGMWEGEWYVCGRDEGGSGMWEGEVVSGCGRVNGM